MPTIKNIIIFVVIATIFILIYVFFIRGSSDDTADLISTSSSGTTTGATGDNASVAQDFLVLLLSVKNIKLDDAILSDSVFAGLHDSSITLTPDGDEGRPNPFAPIGIDNIASSATPLAPPTSSTPVTPPTPATSPAPPTTNIPD